MILSALVILSTFLDYMGMTFFPSVLLFRCIGRMSFPLCCFLIARIVESRGFNWQLFLGLLGLAILSEGTFDALRFSRIFMWQEQNPVFALLIGAAFCGVLQSDALPATHKLLLALVLFPLSMLCDVSYGWLGPALCAGFLVSGTSIPRLALTAILLPLLYAFMYFLSGGTLSWALVLLCMSLSVLPVLLMRNADFHSPALLVLLALSYPVQMITLILLRNSHLIPPYYFG